MTRAEAIRYRAHLNSLITSLDDASALNVLDLFVPWAPDTSYAINDRCKYENKLYKCVQAHTSQSIYPPDIIPALWTRISIEEWPEWIQPIGTQDAYSEGDKVTHNGKHWISEYDANVWEPGVFPQAWREA